MRGSLDGFQGVDAVLRWLCTAAEVDSCKVSVRKGFDGSKIASTHENSTVNLSIRVLTRLCCSLSRWYIELPDESTILVERLLEESRSRPLSAHLCRACLCIELYMLDRFVKWCCGAASVHALLCRSCCTAPPFAGSRLTTPQCITACSL